MRSKPACERDERRAADTAGRAGQHRLHRVLARRLEAHQPAVGAHDLDRRPHVRRPRGRRGRSSGTSRAPARRTRSSASSRCARTRGTRAGSRTRSRPAGRARRTRRSRRSTRSWRPFAWAFSRQTVSASTPSATSSSTRLADGRLVDRLDDRAVGADPLGHLAHVARVGQRLGLLVHHEAEQRPRRPRLGEVEDVPEALS